MHSGSQVAVACEGFADADSVEGIVPIDCDSDIEVSFAQDIAIVEIRRRHRTHHDKCGLGMCPG